MLTDTKVRNAKPRADGKSLTLTDGRYGLELRVLQRKDGDTSKSWRQQIRASDGKRTYVGLGTYPVVSLRQAREAAISNLAKAHVGDEVRTRQQNAAGSKVPTFAEAYETYLAQRDFGNSKHTERQWNQEPRNYLIPAIGDKRITEIRQKDIVAILLKPDDNGKIPWLHKHNVADRLLVYVRLIFRSLVASEQLEVSPISENIRDAFPPRPKKAANHYPAVPVEDIPEAIAAIIGYEKVRRSVKQTSLKPTTMRKLAALFTILTVAHTAESTSANWRQFDLGQLRWTLHGDDMKEREGHRVPLSEQALAIAGATASVPWRKLRGEPTGLLFAETVGDGSGKPLDSSALRNLVQACGCVDEHGRPATMHGFRSSFSMWSAENGYDSELREMTLSHRIRGAVKGAYMRSDLFERRLEMLQAWAHYCMSAVDDPGALQSLYKKLAAGT